MSRNSRIFLDKWMLHHLGGRVVVAGSVDGYPAGAVGRLISLQAGSEPGASGPYATVALDRTDWSNETNVPLSLLRPFSTGM
jgi:hypothetical protein